VDSLFQRHLIFVTGKGGVGKSTVALALGIAAARSGKRTIVAQLAGGDYLQRAFDQRRGGHFEEIRLAPSLYTISIDAQAAMEEYLLVKVPGPVASLLSRSRLFGAFAMATPGMRELLQVGKAWELAQPRRRTREADPYDLVIVDLAATGHGIATLHAPRTFAEIARVGPIAHQGEVIAGTIADREFTAVIAVTTAEEMPVNETLELHEQLLADGLELDAVILNALYPERLSAADAAVLARALQRCSATPGRAAIEATLSEHARAAIQAQQAERLRAPFAGRLVSLPFLFEAELGPPQLERLAALLGEELA
jgi:anion-transporting  ArsA/GET3 family ATPase